MKHRMKIALSIKGAADSVGLSVRTIQRLMAQGKLPFSEFGRRRLILPDDLDQLVRNRRVIKEGNINE